MRISDWSSDVCSSDLKTMANDPQNRAAPGMGWPVAIFIGTAMLAGGFAGYNRAAAETGGPALSPWIGALIATALGVTAFGFYVRRPADWFRDRKSTRLNSSH